MTSVSKKTSARGFSLLEVLIAVVILSVGLLALASLQLSLIRSSSATKAQSLAADLAKDRIEFLRSYTTLAGGSNSYLQLGATSPFTETLNDSGGNQGGVNYTRTTTVTRYVYNKATSGFVVVPNTRTDAQLIADKVAGTIDYSIGKDFKLINVTVGWTDPVSGARTIAMEDIVDGLDPTESSSIAKVPTSTGGPRTLEEKITDPALDNMVIPIALGGGVDSAATNPKPTIVVGGNTVETRFDVLTYVGVNGGTATAQQKVETVMVGCTCTLDSPVATTVRGKRPTYWNGSRYITPVDVATSGSESYSPHGKADPSSSASQSSHCDICCRDHEDPVGVKGATFSPRLVTKDSSDTVTAKHEHYLNKSTATPATSGTYKEACRLIRVDGFWRVAADMENDYFGLLATGDGTTASSYAPDSTSVAGTPSVTGAIARYQNFVLGYMGSRFVSPTPSSGAEQSTYNTIGTPGTLAASATYVLDNPSSVDIGSSITGTPSCTTITGVTNSNPAVVTYSGTFTNCSAGTGTTFANGDRVYITGVTGMTTINNAGSSYTIANIDTAAHTFQLSGIDTTNTTTFPAYTSGGTAEVSYGKWLHTRGIYVDYLEKEATDAITSAKANSSCTASQTALSLCILKLLPFTSINLTEIADWDSADTSKTIVTNNNYSQTLTQTEPVRGEVSFAGGTDGTTVNVNSRSRVYNTSLLDLSFDSISPNDDTKTTDAQTFRISNPAPVSKPGNGTFYTGLSIPYASGIGVSYVTGTQGSKSCSYTVATLRFDCVVNNAESTTVAPVDAEDAGLGIANTMAVVVGGYNSPTPAGGNTTNVPDGTVCTRAAGEPATIPATKTFTAATYGTRTYLSYTCNDYAITAASDTTLGAAATGFTVSNSGTKTESTKINFALINVGDILSTTFTGPTTSTSPLPTCTYACSQYDNTTTDCKSAAKTNLSFSTSTCP